MGKVIAIICIALLIAGLSVPALAMTGFLVNGELPVVDVEWTDEALTTQSFTHDETVQNPDEIYKGWWSVTLTNRTTKIWSSVSIGAGAGDLVAIVQGSGLVDENNVVGTSVLADRPSTYQYMTPIGDGSRVYENGATGWLWNSAKVYFATPVTTGQKVNIKVYTDNSWYSGDWADTFCVCVTPNAVPEPGSLVALASGIVGLVGFARKRKD